MKTILPCLTIMQNITLSKFKYINGGFCVFVVPSAMYIDTGSVMMVEVTDSGLSGNIFSEITTEGAKTHHSYSQLTCIG